MIRRAIHIPGTYHKTASVVPVPVLILQSVTAFCGCLLLYDVGTGRGLARARVASWYFLVLVQFCFFPNQPELTLEFHETSVQAAAAA